MSGLRARLGDERGIALFMAIAIMFVMSVMLVAVITFTSASARHASRSRAGQTAYALAEAGMNDALSQLAALYPSGTTTLYSSTWTPPSGTAALQGGTAGWSSTWSTDGSGFRGTWTITATGTAKNPTGPGSNAIVRTISAAVDVLEQPGTRPTPSIWNYVYSGGTSGGCDMTIDQTTTWTSPLYIPGNLCLQNKGSILQPSNFLAVGGNITISSQQGSIGTNANRIQNVYVAGNCQWWTKLPRVPCDPNTGNTQVWATNYYGYMPYPPIVPPNIDWQQTYSRATPGPYTGCYVSAGTPPVFDNDTTLNKSVPTVFNLTPSSSYTCRSINGGEISWNASTKVLTVSGIVFIDGSIVVDTGPTVVARYSGTATIYTSGSVLFASGSTLCSKVASSGKTCDWAGWAPGINDPMLIFAANGNGDGQVAAGDSVEVDQTNFQGGLYGTNKVDIRNGSTVQGPLISPTSVSPGQSSVSSWPAISSVGAGAPSDGSPPTFEITPPRNVSY